MNLVRKTEQIDFKSLPGDELIEYISFKEEFAKEAEQAFIIFRDRYQRDILRKAEIYCNKFGYSEVVALEVATCAFARVWKYHSFDVKKAKSKNIDKAILLWLYPIVYNEIIKYGKKNSCSEVDEEDLPLIYNIDSLVSMTITEEDITRRKDLKLRLEIIERAMEGLSEKHKIIYLTYKAYETSGAQIPRGVSKKLQEQLELTQSSIRGYKKHTIEKISNYLKYLE